MRIKSSYLWACSVCIMSPDFILFKSSLRISSTSARHDIELLNAMENLKSNYVLIDYESTAENLCHYFLNKIKNASLPKNINKVMVKVMETENTYAEESLDL